MKIVFLGSGAFGLPSLEAIARSGHEVVRVVSQPDRPAGRGKVLMPTPVSAWALEKGVPLHRTENANGEETVALLRGAGADCLVIIAFGQKLSDGVLATAGHGGINLHSSLLPRYRGAAPINWAVLNGDKVAGVSVITVTNVMDGGDILKTARTEVGDSETAGELHDRLALLGAPLLPAVLDEIAAGTVVRVKQDASQKSPAPKLNREMAWVDFSEAAGKVSARVRGLSPWPGVEVEVVDAAGKVRTVAKLLKCRARGEVVHAAERVGVVLANGAVACGVGELELITVQPQGKKPMDVAAFANGYGYGAGVRLRSVVLVRG